jgi:zinc transport system ATP-binding protein
LVLNFVDVSKHYSGSLVLDKVSFSVQPESINVIIGHNGSGKTTIARIALGLDKQYSGKVSRHNSSFLYLPQKIVINNMMPLNAEFIFNNLVSNRGDRQGVLEQLMDFCNFQKIRKTRLSDLSGGQLRKLFISSILAKKADIIIMDEPTQDLDLKSQILFYEIIKSISGTAVILISHDIHSVIKFADQVLCVDHKICCSGSPNSSKSFNQMISPYIHKHLS